MAELVDALVSGASVLRRAGSSPVLGTSCYSVAVSPDTSRSLQVRKSMVVDEMLYICVSGGIGRHATLRG